MGLKRRTTAILGAGAVLDFDFDGLPKPTTQYITDKVVEEKIQGYDEIDSELIKHIYNRIVDASRAEYLRLHPAVRYYEPPISFEDLFEVIETLYSYSGTWKHEHYPFSLISALVKSDLDNYSVDYERAMKAIIKKIVEIVNSYDELFKKDGREKWFKDFWKEFDGKLDVFNFNYDTTIEHSLGDYVDGYVPYTQGYERFEPEVLWNASKDKPTINHLHGCILYGDTNPKRTEYHYSHRDLYKFYPDVLKEAFISGQWMPRNQVGDSIFYSPIITGLKKTDKICFMPHNFYHANLAKKIIENPSLLICGYSFGDLYVNQLIQRHKLVHDKNERVVIVDKWSDYVNEDAVRLYRYFMDCTSGGLREYVIRVLECAFEDILNTFKQFKQVIDGCWESPNGVLRIYTKGFKSAVDGHQSNILSFLQ